jgi:polysaccharide pyruvyl transferase WcaK-like protein
MHFAQRLFVEAQARGWRGVSLMGDQTEPGGLLASMQNYSLVIATRLHASILANSLGISSLGLSWDEKVRAYYVETGLTERCFSLAELQVSGLVRAAHSLNRQPFSATLLTDLKGRARENALVILG